QGPTQGERDLGLVEPAKVPPHGGGSGAITDAVGDTIARDATADKAAPPPLPGSTTDGGKPHA
ncbi:hypothetical protein ABTM01_19680, partial [Acinetobacter baumannii]